MSTLSNLGPSCDDVTVCSLKSRIFGSQADSFCYLIQRENFEELFGLSYVVLMKSLNCLFLGGWRNYSVGNSFLSESRKPRAWRLMGVSSYLYPRLQKVAT